MAVVAAIAELRMGSAADEAAPVAAARAARKENVSEQREFLHYACTSLTAAVRTTIGDDARSLHSIAASLVGTVANTKAKVWVTAIASRVSSLTSELADCDALHVVDTDALFEFLLDRVQYENDVTGENTNTARWEVSESRS